jgi:hypothetical protein
VKSQVAAFLFKEGLSGNNHEDLVRSVVLVLPREDEAGLYACFVSDDQDECNTDYKPHQEISHNVRATRLSMACGLFALRFYDAVILIRSTLNGKIQPLKVSDVELACCVTPDLRLDIVERIRNDFDVAKFIKLPEWITNAAQQNYHDKAVLERLAKVMSVKSNQEIEHDHEFEICNSTMLETGDIPTPVVDNGASTAKAVSTTFVARDPLCLHCRRPCHDLCPKCNGAYFCETPSTCSTQG